MNVTLTDEELALVVPFFNSTDAAKQGYAQGLEMAKTLLVQQIVARRPTNESVASTAGAESAQHAAETATANAAPNGHA